MNDKLNEVMKHIRKAGLEKYKGRRRAVFWKEKDFIDEPVDAGVVILPTRGCRWGLASGCTMCGYVYDSANLTQEEILNQFNYALQNLGNVQYLKIFNSGSFFDPVELSNETRSKIFQNINGVDAIRMLQVESRPEFLSREILEKAKNELNSKLEIGLGLETTSDYIRENCINKNAALEDFRSAIYACKSLHIYVKAYILIKPPFLTEQEGVQDAVNSAIDAYKLGASKISFNPMNIQKGTLAEHLYTHGEYRAPWLWSVVEILKEVKKNVSTPVISHPTAAGKERGAHNCGECDNEVYAGIMNFSATQNLSFIENLTCTCKERWSDVLKLERFEHSFCR